MADEITDLVGEVAFEAFLNEMARRLPAQLLPHPALKKRP